MVPKQVADEEAGCRRQVESSTSGLGLGSRAQDRDHWPHGYCEPSHHDGALIDEAG